tara:strand:- start:2678 stop:2917 length:240 start_codon:yes stop_codon:yes gene_type:complete
MKQLTLTAATLGAVGTVTELSDKWLSRSIVRDFLDAIDVTDGATRIFSGFVSVVDHVEASGLLVDLISMLGTVGDLVIA